LRDAEQKFRELAISSADLYAKKVLFPYAAVRILKPEGVVETGIANGVSSAYILLALHRKQREKLYSIGPPDPAYFFTTVFTRTNTCPGSSKSRILFYAWENFYLRTTPSGILRLRASRARLAHRRPAFSTA